MRISLSQRVSMKRNHFPRRSFLKISAAALGAARPRRVSQVAWCCVPDARQLSASASTTFGNAPPDNAASVKLTSPETDLLGREQYTFVEITRAPEIAA